MQLNKAGSAKQKSSQETFADAAARPLLLLFFLALVFFFLLLWALNSLSQLVSSQAAINEAVNWSDQSITIAITEEPPQLNNSLSTDQSSGMILGHVMEGLLRFADNGSIEAGIAERWEITPTKATFWIREEARWSDGSPILAKDFVFSWTTALLPETASEYAFLLYTIKNGRAVNEGLLPVTQLGLSAPRPRKLVVELERPVAYFDKLMTFPTYFPIQEEFYSQRSDRFGADAEDLIYSGPFIIKTWVHGARLLLEKNPFYWDKENIRLNEINIGYITQDASARLNFFQDGKIALSDLTADNLDIAMKNRWSIKESQDGALFFLEFNHRKERLTSNLFFRKALQHTIDMDELVYKVTKLPGYLPGESLFPVWLRGANRLLREEYPPPLVDLDLGLAKQYLQQAQQELDIEKWPDLVLLAGDTPTANTQSEWLQGVLKSKLGLNIKIDKQIFKQRLAKMTSGEFDMVMAGWGPDYDDPLTFGDLFASWNLNNRGRYASHEMDQAIEIAQSSNVPKERMEAFHSIQRIIFDDAVILPMYERGLTYVIHPQLKNVKRRVLGASTDYTKAYVTPLP